MPDIHTGEARTGQKGGGSTKIKWDISDMRSTYANVCNASFTREEIILLFGVNKAWDSGQNEISIQLTDRVIMNPFAVKRLAVKLDGMLNEYEKRYGSLEVTPQAEPQVPDGKK